MARRAWSLIVDAAVFKPVTVFRDFAILWSIGLGWEADRYFSAMTVLVLMHAMAVGSMANAWIPVASKHPQAALFRLIWSSFKRESLAAAALALSLSCLVLIALQISTDSTVDAYLNTFLYLAPIGAFAYLQGWLGNYFYASGTLRTAQFTWALPSIVLVIASPTILLAAPIIGKMAALALVTYLAYAGGFAASLWLLRRLQPRCDHQGYDDNTIPASISLGTRAAAAWEVGGFATMNYLLLILLGQLGPGASAMLALVMRVYTALSTVIVTPLSQSILLGGSRRDIVPSVANQSIPTWGVVVLALGLSVPVAAVAALMFAPSGITSTWQELPRTAAMWAPIFILMSIIQIQARRLAVAERYYRVPWICGAAYFVACLLLYSLPIHDLQTRMIAGIYLPLGVLCICLAVPSITSKHT